MKTKSFILYESHHKMLKEIAMKEDVSMKHKMEELIEAEYRKVFNKKQPKQE